ncbi:MAG: hypothetical protein FJ395_00405 [Verrucomicrobia bacterium]|nr:hypothetical protein [Verrucomicrobiota bacterium]
MNPLHPQSERKPFFDFKVEDIFWISGHGAVVTGTVIKGAVRAGAAAFLKKANGETKPIRITGIEGFRKILKEALMGENVGLTIADLDKDDFDIGDVITFES